VKLEGPHKPHLDEMGIALYHETKPSRAGKNVPRKPNLDEMSPGSPDEARSAKAGVEAVPARPREGGPVAGRSKLGRPGMHGGFKKRGR
jgi:excinuclease ABC subunit B